MGKENPVIVVKKYNIGKHRVTESQVPRDGIGEAVQSCQNLNQMAAPEKETHSETEETHYVGEAGVMDYKLGN